MSFERLNYTKDWNDPGDFPTYEDSESQVRADMQFHPDAIRDYLNDTLLAALESSAGAESIGAQTGSVQEVLTQCLTDIQALAAGGVPTASQCVQVDFAEDDWEETAVSEDPENEEEAETVWTLSIGQEQHRRPGATFGYNLRQLVDGALMSNTWGVAATRVSTMAADRTIALTSAQPYAGAITFFGL